MTKPSDFAEAMTMAYHRSHGVDTRIVRIFNTYGPRMRLNDGRVLPNFFYQALVGQPHHRLWRRETNAKFLLRFGFDRGNLSFTRIARARAGEYRQSA